MKLKKLAGIFLAFAGLSSVSAMGEECAGTAYVYDDNGQLVEFDETIHGSEEPVYYSGSALIPNLYLYSNRQTTIFIKNISERPVNFFFRPTFYAESDGQEAAMSPEVFSGVFTSANSPKNSAGALMRAGTFGKIHIPFVQSSYSGYAKIYWDSATCGSEPILATSEGLWYQNYNGGRGGVTSYHVNNGKPF